MADKKKPRTDKDGRSSAGESITLEIELEFPKELTSRYANHVMIQRGPNESYLSFFELQPPVIVGTPEERDQQRKQLKSVRAVCVARLIIPNGFLPAVLKMFQENVPQEPTQADQGE